MSNLTIKPISFNSKTNEVIIDKEVFQWKKQKATLSKKKNISAIEYLNLNYGNLINNNKGGVVFAYFDYNDNSTIYLMYSPNDKDKKSNDKKSNDKNNKLQTDLYFDLYIPSINSVEIVEETYDIETTDEKIIVDGKVFGFCIDNNTYYFKNIEINEYIELVQRNNDTNEEDLLDKYNLKDNEDEDDVLDYDDEDDDAIDDPDAIDEDDDNDDNDDDNDDDEDNDDDDKDNDNDNEDDDEIEINNICKDSDLDDEKEDDEKEDEDEKEDDEKEDDEDEIIEAVDYEEPGGDDGIDGEELVDLDTEDYTVKKTKRKKRISKNTKLVKSINVDDLNIIFNILKEEVKDIITPDKDLDIKRQKSIKILKTLKLPLKTIQRIEQGIYNYTIEKCILRHTIPIWQNSEFINIYVNKTQNLYLNLNINSYVKNINLIEKIKNKEILPYDLAFMDIYKLCPEVWSDIIDEKTKIEKMLRESLEESASNLFKCPRCNKRKTIHCEVQTRSSDEPMTTFITCLECGKKWKKY